MNYIAAACKILKKSVIPLHYKEITRRAIKKGLLKSEGSTPWITMSTRISESINKEGEESCFIRSEPGYYKYKPKDYKVTLNEQLRLIGDTRNNLKKINTKQKGDIAEARVVELVTLYGAEGLTCYRPVSDDEGIDIIVKRRNSTDTSYIQVKSSYGKRFVSTVKDSLLIDKSINILVFVYYDLIEGDLLDKVFCVPADAFKHLTKITKSGRRTFTVGLTHPERSKFAEYMIEKRELANRIIEIMNKFYN